MEEEELRREERRTLQQQFLSSVLASSKVITVNANRLSTQLTIGLAGPVGMDILFTWADFSDFLFDTSSPERNFFEDIVALVSSTAGKFRQFFDVCSISNLSTYW